MTNCNSASTSLANLNPPATICGIPSAAGPALTNLQKCCGSAPISTTSDGCYKYCQYGTYSSSLIDTFTACLDDQGGPLGAECVASKADAKASVSAIKSAIASETSSVVSSATSATTTATPSAISTSGAGMAVRGPEVGWTKVAMAVGFMGLVCRGLVA